MIRLDIRHDHMFGWFCLEELRRQAKALLGQSQSNEDHRLHNLTEWGDPLLVILNDVDIDLIGQF